MEEWLPGVIQSIKTTISNGGKINFHLDGLSNLNALHNVASDHFRSASLTELRYLIDNDLLNHVNFKHGGGTAPADIMGQLNEAIDMYRKSEVSGTFKGEDLLQKILC